MPAIIGDKGLALIKSFEGLRLEAYLDSVNVPTIGYGHILGVKMGDVCTQEQADQFLLDDLADAIGGVVSLVRVPLNQHQFDALVSFTFNLGRGNLAQSTLLKKLNLSDYDGAASEILKWDRAGGVKLKGLTRRREAEKELFLLKESP